MHEASLVKDLVARSLRIAEKGEGSPVAVGVRLGALSHIDVANLRDHFAVAAAGTRLEGTRLDVEVDDDPGHARAQDVTLLYVDLLDEGGD